jgi:DNA-binding protein H-NS
MTLLTASTHGHEAGLSPLAFQGAPVADAPLDREGALREIGRLMTQFQLSPAELVDPAERQAALGKARRLVDFWRITPEELDGPPPARQSPYRYTHPKTGQTWDGLGRQPDWLRRCLLTEGYRLDEVRTPTAAASLN